MFAEKAAQDPFDIILHYHKTTVWHYNLCHGLLCVGSVIHRVSEKKRANLSFALCA